jgi:hypothetical protein
MKLGETIKLTPSYQLLQSPSFHHAVRKVHKNVHRMRHGSIEGDLGGTNIESLYHPFQSASIMLFRVF